MIGQFNCSLSCKEQISPELVTNSPKGKIIPSEESPLLPKQASHHFGRKTLVLDLDETLIHATPYTLKTNDFTLVV